MKTSKSAQSAVRAIIKDLTDRRGLRQEWEAIDDNGIYHEIKSEWARLIDECFADERARKDAP